MTRRALLGGALAAGVLGTTAAVLLRNGPAGTSGPVRWLLPSDQAWLGSGPWLVGGVLLAENPDSLLESRSPTDGSRRWASSVRISSGVALNDVEGVYVGFPGAIQGGVVGVDLASGTRLWQQSIEAPTAYPAAPVAATGRAVLVGRADRDPAAVYAFGPRDGTQLWRTELAGNLAYGVAVDGDFAYSADEQGYAYGIDIATGVIRWRARVTEQIGGAYSRPVAAAGRLYLADRDALYALDGRTGQPVWTRTIDEGVGESESPLVVDDRIYLSAVEGTLHAVNAADGTVGWTAQVGSGRPVLAGPVACTSAADEVFGIALDSGRTLWRRPISSDYDTWPVLAGGLFHLADDSGVVSLEPSSGQPVRTVGEDDKVSGAHALDTDGTALYLAVYNDGPALCSLTLPNPPG